MSPSNESYLSHQSAPGHESESDPGSRGGTGSVEEARRSVEEPGLSMAHSFAPNGHKSGFKYSLLDGLTPDFSPEDHSLWPRSLARRWFVVLFVGTCLLYCARMAMPICAVTMASTFHWTKIDTGVVLGGFFWGYCITQILGGYVSDKIGGERVLLMSAASWGVITAGTPLMARLCSRTLFLMTTARFLMGLLQGVFFPSLASLCSHRVVKAERGFLMSILHSGTYLGTLVAGGLGSVMLQSYGWEYLFYCIGFSSGLWALLIWYFLVKGREIPKQKHVENGRPHSKTRWLSFIKKPPVWSMMIAHTCAASTFYTLLSWLPTYFEESFPNAKGGVYNTVPWIAAIPASLVGGWVSDFLITKGYRVVYVRKLMQVVAMGIPVLFILPMSNAVSLSTAVTLTTVAIGATTFSSGGVAVNVQDLAPSCAGALYGFMNMMGALTGVVTVSLSGYLIEVTQTWATVFSLVALINSSGLGVYLVFGDAQRLDQGSPVTII
ncbi:solute carrier family 17 member 9-like [Periophthalmus magnuspinnatus]|uniref:solute carrier family 17 member 9-like n=1 Tax=Periophthalmus magnuspinnatus TaxID=409849 RepID=UPI00145AD3F1|nr:solute carrier family 17 member 9-like [Periophthalmus magnuspinnatus]